MGIMQSMASGKVSRRALVRSGVLTAGGVSLALLGCGGDEEDSGGSDAPDTAAGTSVPGAAAAPGEPKRGGTLSIYGTADPPTLDPHLTSAAGSYQFLNLLYSRLLTFDASEDVGPYANVLQGDLADHWESTPDGLEHTFTLRDGLVWQDVEPVKGRNLTAQDVASALNRLRTPDPQFTNAFIFNVVDTIEAVDDKTVKFTLTEPFAPFIENVAHQNALIVPQELIDRDGDATKAAVGSGRFILEEAQTGARYTLRRNDNYYFEGRPYIDGIDFLIIPDQALQISGIRAGQLDRYGTSQKAQVDDLLASNNDLATHRLPGGSGTRLVLNNAREPYNDVRVRTAIDKALDRQALIDTYLKGDGRLMSILGANMMPWDIPREEITAFWAQDLDEATKLMDAAGLADGFDTEWENQSAPQLPALEFIQSQLRAIKVNISIKSVEYAEWQQHANTQDFTGFLTDIRAFTDPDNILFRNYHPQSAQRWVDLTPSEYAPIVDLIGRQRVELDIEARRDVVHQGIRTILDQHLLPGLYDPPSYTVLQPRVKGYAPSGLSGELEIGYVWLDA